jgi:type IV pilus assembly protein PilA
MINTLKTHRKKKGFTLIELIIVLAVMAVISTIAVPNVIALRDNSKKKADKQSCEVIKRTVMSLVADDTIKSRTTITVTPNSTTGIISGQLTESEKTALQDALKDIKAPQSPGATDGAYIIAIDSNESVKVSTKDSN